MGKRKKVAILAVRFGNGHWRAAQALKKAIEECYPGVQIDILNYLVFAGHIVDWLTRLVYHDLMIRIPWLYRRWFAFTNRLRPDSTWQRVIDTCGRHNFLRYLKHNSPDLLIATFPVPAAVVSRLKERGVISLPLVTVITDYTLHRQWIQPGTDLYIVANQEMKDELVHSGIPGERVAACGIPINANPPARFYPSKQFLDTSYKEKIPLVLVINGVTNFNGDLGNICRTLADFPLPLRAQVVAVNDPALRLHLRRIVQGRHNRVVIGGFTSDLWRLMRAATCLICKAGGMTVSEALALELPLLIYRPLPCQEEKNRAYLVNSGAALAADNIGELAVALKQILQDPVLRRQLQTRASRLKKPDAARDAALLLESYLT